MSNVKLSKIAFPNRNLGKRRAWILFPKFLFGKGFIGLATFFIIFTSYTFSKDIIVSPNTNISSIKQAIELSQNGDRIIIKKGYYKEHNIIIDKSIQLIGEDYPELDGEKIDDIIIIKSNNVYIKGIVVKNSGSSSMKDIAGVRFDNVKYCTIEDSRFYDNFFAVYLAGSSFCTVKYNIIKSNAQNETSSGNGIHLWKCENITIENNEISGHRDGIYFEFVTDSKIISNISRWNLRYGLHFMFSNGDTYEKNYFSNNGAGVAVMYTKDVSMIDNRFEDNWGPNAYGLLLKDISFSTIERNTFKKNTVGIYMEGGTSLNVNHNSFIENGWALKVLGDCTDDSIKYNNFIGNTFDVSTNSSISVNLFNGNYWDKYKGYDLNKDGIGDVSYRPVSMFSMIVEKTPETIFLLRSIIVDILDIAEKVAPVFIPETLVDNNPSIYEISNREQITNNPTGTASQQITGNK
ncbi:MAG: nitrous oxide reductase family maturation protein NosD [Ignavibacteriae bacterium]|nr:MAG: nitrous oxide reductase family maturation protein NosD [Ignavibacteriota bacterium]